MRLLATLVVAAFLLSPAPVPAADALLSESDATAKWTYPYKAPAEKEKKIREGLEVLLKGQRGTPVSRFIEVLGTPDQITDMHKGFEGMSPNEDGMLVEYRQYLSHRLVWYISKSSAGHSLDDIWFAAYVGNGGDGVLKIMRNNFK
jgi:hypothetical protein